MDTTMLKKRMNGGAIAAIVEKGNRGIRVKNVQKALSYLANLWLKELNAKVIGITGSVGKTTTKEFIATLLEVRFIVGKTARSYNTHITLPVAILNCDEAQIFIAEMGSTEPGDIEKKMEIAPVDIGVLTHVSHSHYAFFESIEALALEKGAILKCSTPIMSEQATSLVKPCGEVYGMKSGTADMTIYHQKDKWQLRYQNDFSPLFDLPFSAHHHVENFICAALVAKKCGLSFEEIVTQAQKLKPFEHRFQLVQKGDVTFVDDSYNASVASFEAAFAALPKGKRKIAVIGEMGELGSYTKEAHEIVAKVALGSVDEVLCVGEQCLPIVKKFKKKGHFFHSVEELRLQLKKMVKEGDVVLVKGANRHKLWEVIE